MKNVAYQQILTEKWARQEKLMALGAYRHACGHAFHTGEISFGCRDCFSGEASINLFVGTSCMFHCPYCYYDPARTDEALLQELEKETAFTAYKLKEFEHYRPGIISYCSAGETLLYMDVIEGAARRLLPLLYQKGIKPYTFLYTNGVLADDAMLERLSRIGVNEVRFHISASDFSDQVFAHMEAAKARGMILTVEEPANPLNRDRLMAYLPEFERMGLDHLDLIEMRLTAENIEAVERMFPGDDYLCYKDFYYHLYDNGMVYDIMEETLKKGYHFSVMDCNSGVERCRNNQDQDVRFTWDTIDGMCRSFDTGTGFAPRLKNGKKYRE